MRRLIVLLLAFVACLSFAQDQIKADADGWTNLEFLDGMIKFRAPFDLDEVDSDECPSFVSNPKEQVKTSFYSAKDDKVACAVAIFESADHSLKIDINDKSKEDSWLKVVKGSYRTSKKGEWSCISGDAKLENGGSVFLRFFYSDHKAIAFAVFCQDAKDPETKKVRKQILDSFVFDIKAEKKELLSR